MDGFDSREPGKMQTTPLVQSRATVITDDNTDEKVKTRALLVGFIVFSVFWTSTSHV